MSDNDKPQTDEREKLKEALRAAADEESPPEYFYLVRTRIGEFTVYTGTFPPSDLKTRLMRSRTEWLSFEDGVVSTDDISSIKAYPVACLLRLPAEPDAWDALAEFISWSGKKDIPLSLDDAGGPPPPDLGEDDDDDDGDDDAEEPADQPGPAKYRAAP